MMNVREIALLAVLLFVGVAASPANMIYDLVDGDVDSGWSVVLSDDVHTGIVVDRVTDSYVRIEIAKTLYLGPTGGQFPAHVIGFFQRLDDAHTVSQIQITSEIVANATGRDWTDYHWAILGDEAAFNATATDASGFSIDPFTSRAWGAAPAGWSQDHAVSLDVWGGVVHDGETFYPGSPTGRLLIDADLTGDDEARFTLAQTPTPEPATMGLLGVGGIMLFIRHRHRRRGA